MASKDQNILKESQTNALNLFHQVAKRVPAYQDFLKKHDVDAEKIKTIDDFHLLPEVTKENYLHKYPLDKLQWDGNLDSTVIFSASSGSTGVPYIWGRNEEVEEHSCNYYKRITLGQFEAEKKKTLFMVSFSLGSWAAGTATMIAGLRMRQEGNDIAVVTPGANEAEIINYLENLSPHYEQTIIGGYPPFVKSTLDQAAYQGIDIKKLNIKLMFGGEPITEVWRDHVADLVGQKNPLLTTTNIYGSSEALVMATETPLSIAVSKCVNKSSELINTLFHTDRTPSFTQYDPRSHYFEEEDNELIYTVNSAIPLIRYNSKDKGGLYSYKTLTDRLGSDLQNMLKQYKVTDRHLEKLPFIYVYGRDFNTVSFYSLNIYPENIQAGLFDEKVRKQVSGKFLASTEYDKDQDQYLLIRIELAPGVKQSNSLKEKVRDSLVKHIKEMNSEYKELTNMIGERSVPVVELYENGDSQFQLKGNKLKTTKK